MNKTMGRWSIIAVAGLAALGAGLYFGGFGRLDAPPPAAPAAVSGLLGMALPDADGKEQRLDQWRGKVIVVNFWATWCAPCREEMPEFVRAQTEFGPKGLQFVGIAVDQPDKVRQFATEIGLNYPSLIGGFGAMELSKSLGNSVMALPFSVVIDRQGSVVHTQLGILKPQKLDSIVRQLL
jgi:thiol-disulfide isomerase/thioredoxin